MTDFLARFLDDSSRWRTKSRAAANTTQLRDDAVADRSAAPLPVGTKRRADGRDACVSVAVKPSSPLDRSIARLSLAAAPRSPPAESKHAASAFDPPGVELMAHQVAVCEEMMRLPRGMLVHHAMGSGKTLTALSTARAMLARGAVDNVIVVVPKTLKPYWEKQTTRVGLGPPRVCVDTHRRFFNKYGSPCSAERASVGSRTLLIVDEVHNMRTDIKKRDAARGRCMAANFVEACGAAGKVLLLTGTAMVNGLRDFVNIATALDGRSWSDGTTAYRKEDLALRSLAGRVHFYEPDAKTSTRVLRMPELREVPHDFVMDAEYRAWYERIEAKQIEAMFKTHTGTGDLTVFLNGVRRAVNGSAANDEGPRSPKVAWIEAAAAGWAARGEKFVVYSAWLEFGASQITAALERAKVSYGVIDGAQSTSDRQQSVSRFNAGGTQALVFTAAGAEGVDLEGTRHVVILEPHWHESRIDQAIARARRVGSHAHLPESQRFVDVHRLMLRRIAGDAADKQRESLSADELLRDIAAQKKDVYVATVKPFLVKCTADAAAAAAAL